jgi:hypothetical protein
MAGLAWARPVFYAIYFGSKYFPIFDRSDRFSASAESPLIALTKIALTKPKALLTRSHTIAYPGS